MIAASSPTEGSDPSSSPSSAAVSESPSGPSAIVWAPCARISAPSYSGRKVISTIDGVRGMTVRKSASIDSLTASIQCTSSMMNSAGSVRASVVAFTSAVNRRRRASGSMAGSATSGSAMPSRSSSSSRSCGSASGTYARNPARAASPSRSATPLPARSSRATTPKGTSLAWDSQKVQNTSTPRPAASAAASRATRLLPMPGGPTTFTHTTAATDRALHQGVKGRHLPASTDQARLGAPDQALPRADPHQPARGNRFVGALDVHPFRFRQRHGVLDQPRGGLREHHPARGRHRFHPLGEPDRLADRGVTQRPRTELTGDHPTRIQAHPQLQRHAVAALHLGGQPVRLFLDGQRSETCAKSVILQRHRGAEERHHPVAGVCPRSRRRSAAPPPPTVPRARS